jgi:hypothetical protein
MLEQMERALVEEDPKLASTLRGTSMRRTARRRAVTAGVVFAAGVAVLMTGVITTYWVVGVVGFVIMLASATVAVTALRGRQSAPPSQQRPAGGGGHGFTVIDGGRSGRGRGRLRHSRGSSSASSASGSFMHRMEERWRRRRDQNGGGFQ